ncbi:MAG: potassium channel protein, partial [Caldilineae bacterium]
TVGFGELGEFDAVTRMFATLLILFTLAWGAWALQSVLGIILSPEVRVAMRQIRAIRRAKRMKDHTIICGYGRIGRAVAAEFARNDSPFVIIEADVELAEGLREQGLHVIHGDATDDDVLLAAGIEHARRLIAVLNEDNDNIVTVLSARQLNPKLWIASRVVQPESAAKLLKAGANEVISPYDAGGRRLALAALRPHVGEFLKEVIFDEGRGAELDELEVRSGSELAERTLGETNLRRRFGVTVLALYHPHGHSSDQLAGFELNPGSDTVLHEGDVLIVVGNAERLSRLHRALGA